MHGPNGQKWIEVDRMDKSTPKWTEMEQRGRNGWNGPYWTEMDQMDKNESNEQKWTE